MSKLLVTGGNRARDQAFWVSEVATVKRTWTEKGFSLAKTRLCRVLYKPNQLHKKKTITN